MSSATTGILLFATGLIHNILGILSPRLREPLLRIVADGGTLVVADKNERYAREDTFWFQFAGIALMIHGWHVRSTAQRLENEGLDSTSITKVTHPTWLGWTVLAVGSIGAYIKPVSGFHLVYAQGLRLLWIQHKNKKLS